MKRLIFVVLEKSFIWRNRRPLFIAELHQHEFVIWTQILESRIPKLLKSEIEQIIIMS